MLENNYNKPYFLIPSAFLVEGSSKILVFDTERNKNFSVPIKFKKLLLNPNNVIIEEAIKQYGYSKVEFDLILKFLMENDLIYFSENINNYVKIKSQFDYPAQFSNAIIDIKENYYLTDSLFKQLEDINCFHLQIRFLEVTNLDKLEKLIEALNKVFLMSVELAISCDNSVNENLLLDIINNNPVLDAIFCFDYPSEFISDKVSSPAQILYFTTQKLSTHSCGIISPEYFTTSILAYAESTKFNSCLNRKISIDSNGNIKNCPSMTESFGNINDTTLAEAIEKPGFKKYWNINKDKIHVCKDCEFRYVCTDCRAYVEDPEDIYSKPLKCGYNPIHRRMVRMEYESIEAESDSVLWDGEIGGEFLKYFLHCNFFAVVECNLKVKAFRDILRTL